ncbi:UNVERIFIED_CONTAM: hypothetical protein Slati_1822200 [Sesamum latifolium]|uniref:DNL-type domain-containing protein n=1 Tax=Sesamum latifolium TaxID=2727402 RepID=A0AAW2WZI8_9LAMI
MAAANSCKILGYHSSLCFTRSAHIKTEHPTSSIPCSQFFRANHGSSSKAFTLPRLRISHRRNKGLEQCYRVPRISCLLEDSYEEYQETEQSVSKNSQQDGAIDLKLPRRSLLVTFTCGACGVRSQRLINRLAYERGLVYVQCSGCSKYHKLVDNLGLVIEYNFQEEIDLDASTDQEVLEGFEQWVLVLVHDDDACACASFLVLPGAGAVWGTSSAAGTGDAIGGVGAGTGAALGGDTGARTTGAGAGAFVAGAGAGGGCCVGVGDACGGGTAGGRTGDETGGCGGGNAGGWAGLATGGLGGGCGGAMVGLEAGGPLGDGEVVGVATGTATGTVGGGGIVDGGGVVGGGTVDGSGVVGGGTVDGVLVGKAAGAWALMVIDKMQKQERQAHRNAAAILEMVGVDYNLHLYLYI